ncbi:hypothetical protein NDN08_007307 [Rhodosorus marinus]|uniref:Rieske domain-containing protein n=1 Tax=Rhodosorus marinus TaxID=101924 RepID=A0AAV8UG60_9RHOD|nr:hypothetical protein NDN08_007307 [Rhodosorus marinus]
MEKVGGPDLVPKRPGARTLLTVSGRRIGLVRTADGNLHALDAICYHMGGPLVASGDLEEIGTRQCLKCPWHKYLLDIRTGEGLYRDLDFTWSSKGVKQRIHEVEERSTGVFVRLKEEGSIERPRRRITGRCQRRARTPLMCQSEAEDKLGISFTCGKCDTRISKKVKRQSYTEGVVIIECPTCKSRHLIADNLGWYKDWTGSTMGNIEQLADKLGQKVIRVDPSKFNLEGTDGAE